MRENGLTADGHPKELRDEDGIIAYTWNHFVLKDNHSPEWLLRLPMTKAVVKAMDAVTDYAKKALGVSVESYVVGGASKRGWTTWTTGVVDKRCAAIVPVVMDLLNLAENTDHIYEVGCSDSLDVRFELSHTLCLLCFTISRSADGRLNTRTTLPPRWLGQIREPRSSPALRTSSIHIPTSLPSEAPHLRGRRRTLSLCRSWSLMAGMTSSSYPMITTSVSCNSLRRRSCFCSKSKFL